MDQREYIQPDHAFHPALSLKDVTYKLMGKVPFDFNQ
jgi:hypothetical protein